MLGQPIPERLPFESGTVDAILLRGTFNVPVAGEDAERLLDETFRVLRPGGVLTAHILTANRTPSAPLALPGLAAYVRTAPLQTDLTRLFERAGFSGIEFKTYRPGPCFEQAGAELRETLLTGTRPAAGASKEMLEVLYRGPYASVELDGGVRVPRGERVRIPEQLANELKRGPLSDAFVVFPAPAVLTQLTACST
jgi:SAM-dependent methyltransferase